MRYPNRYREMMRAVRQRERDRKRRQSRLFQDNPLFYNVPLYYIPVESEEPEKPEELKPDWAKEGF